MLQSPRMSDIYIQGGRVIDPNSGFDQTADVLINNGVIAQIGRISKPANAKHIDAQGCIVSPGLIDIHVHLREPDPNHDETVQTGASAAIQGGFTTICCMPNTKPPLDNASMVKFVQTQAQQANAARVFVVGCATQGRLGERPAEIRAMAEAGAVAFSDDGDCVADSAMMRKVLQTVKEADSCFMQHCQDPALTVDAVMNTGVMATKLALTGWPGIAEENIIERDVRLNAAIGCRYHAQHLSSGGSVEIIRKAQANHQPVTAEVSPHHLLLTEDLCDDYNTMAKMNPPLRTQADIRLLKQGVADGTITVLGTDHAPHPLHRKQTTFADAAFGIVGLECALPLYIKALIEDGVLDWPAMLAMMTINPAQLVGIDKLGLGSLKVGGPGDVTVIDPKHNWTINCQNFASKGRNCPFDGWQVEGKAIATIVSGKGQLLPESQHIRA